MNPIGVIRAIRRRTRLLSSLGIDPGDVVLEVGSGQAPNPRSNVLCDLFVGDDTERNQSPLILDRPLVVGDVQNLPFQDGSFDYVICSHVLEHVEDPQRAAAELSRVAPRGYIEVPSLLHERMSPFPFHRWLIEREGDGGLVFRTKEEPVPDPEMAAWFRKVSDRDPDWMEFLFDHLEALGNVHGVRWEGTPVLRVEGPPGPSSGSLPDPDPEEISRALNRDSRRRFSHFLLGAYWARIRRQSSLRADEVSERLACPACGSGVVRSGREELACRDCEKVYPVVEGGGHRVPVLVAGPDDNPSSPVADDGTGGEAGE